MPEPRDECPPDCPDPSCGDGAIDPGEACDPGMGTGCRPDCTLIACGDGILDAGEACDAGASNSDSTPDTCRTTCVNPSCGDGVADSGEACDDGVLNADDLADACRTRCVAPSCGDAVLDSGEACDDGVLNSDLVADACRAGCALPSCGDGVVDTGEACDEAESNSDELPDRCRSDCQAPRCGDAVVDSGEACDEGPDNSDVQPDACRSSCELPACGDGVVDAGEACDDGNELPEDGCDACRWECGDGVLQPGEACEDSNRVAGDGCSDTCTFDGSCGEVADLRSAAVWDGTGFRLDTSTRGELNDVPSSCGGHFQNEDVTYGLFVVTRSRLDARVESSHPRALSARTSCSDPDSELGCSSTGSLSVPIPAGTQVWITVDDIGLPRGSAFHLEGSLRPLRARGEACDPSGASDVCENGDACPADTATCTAPRCGDGVVSATEFCDSSPDCDHGCRWLGESCSNTRKIVLDADHGFEVQASTARADVNHWYSCSSRAAADLVFAFTAVIDAAYTIRADADFDVALAATRACAARDQQIGCATRGESIELTLDAGATVYLGVSGEAASARGAFTLTGTARPVLAKGEACDPDRATDVCAAGLACPAATARCSDAACGDGVLTAEAGEECDDGNSGAGDGCGTTCQIEGDTCVDVNLIQPTVEQPDFTVRSDTTFADADLTLTCVNSVPGGDRIFGLQSPAHALYDLTLQGVGYPALEVRSVCEDSSQALACSWTWRGEEERVTVELQQGETVYAIVDTTGVPGPFDLMGVGRPARGAGEACDVLALKDGCAGDLVCPPDQGECTVNRCGDGVAGGNEACDDGNADEGDACLSTCVESGDDCDHPVDLRRLDEDPADDRIAVNGTFVRRTDKARPGCFSADVLYRRPDVLFTLSGDGDTSEEWTFEVTTSELPASLDVTESCSQPHRTRGCSPYGEPVTFVLGPDDRVWVRVDMTRQPATTSPRFQLVGTRRLVAQAEGECSDDVGCPQRSDCIDGVCVAAVCGNGTIEAGETCDDRNLAAGDGCSPGCRIEGDECTTALDLNALDTNPNATEWDHEGTIAGMLPGPAGRCYDAGDRPDATYVFEAPKTALYRFTLTENSDDYLVYVWTDCPPAADEFGCTWRQAVRVPMNAGQRVFVHVDPRPGTTTETFTLRAFEE